MLCSPQIQIPSVTGQHYYNTIDCILGAVSFISCASHSTSHSPSLILSIPLSPFPLATTRVCSLYLEGLFLLCLFVHFFRLLDSTCKWSDVVFVFLWLIWLSIYHRSIHVVSDGRISFLLWLIDTPLCVYIHTLRLLPLAFISNAAINIGDILSFQVVFLFSLG